MTLIQALERQVLESLEFKSSLVYIADVKSVRAT